MAILVNAQSKILLQVLTALDDPRSPLHLPYFASNTVGWVGVSGATPANRGHWLLDSLPAYASLAEAVAETGADVSVVMADADLVADAVIDAIDARIPLVVALSPPPSEEDRQRIAQRLQNSDTILLGPDNPEVISPAAARIGAIPDYLCSQGQVGILSQSAGMTPVAALQTSALGLGQSSIVNLGRKNFQETAFRRCLELFLADAATKGLVLILDEGARLDEDLLALLASHRLAKPVVAHVCEEQRGFAAPPPASDNLLSFAAEAKLRQIEALKEAGVIVAESPARIGAHMDAALKQRAAEATRKQSYRDYVSAMRGVEEECYPTAG